MPNVCASVAGANSPLRNTLAVTTGSTRRTLFVAQTTVTVVCGNFDTGARTVGGSGLTNNLAGTSKTELTGLASCTTSTTVVDVVLRINTGARTVGEAGRT